MSNRTTRPNSRELKKIKAYLLTRDGSKCNICKHDFHEKQLIVEHIDNNFLNWDPENLQLACQRCNVSKDPPYANKRDIDNSCVRVRVCGGTEEKPRPHSAEMARNLKSEPLFRNWLSTEMKRKLRMDLNDIVDSGAEYAGVSVDTIRNRYLKKLTSRLGPFKVVEETGIRILEWKEEYFPFNEELKKWK